MKLTWTILKKLEEDSGVKINIYPGQRSEDFEIWAEYKKILIQIDNEVELEFLIHKTDDFLRKLNL